MATQSESSTRSDSRRSEGGQGSRSAKSQGGNGRGRRSANGSAFSWGSGVLGAAAAGAAIAVAANLGRKFVMQAMVAGRGDWDEALKTEHRMALAIFDKILATDESQTIRRSMLLMKLKHALDKHEHEEEHVVYPALRLSNESHDADVLQAEHGYVDTYLYELENMPKDSPEWIGKVREFRAAIAKHVRMEEEQVFPRLKQAMSEEQNTRLTRKVNQDGFMMA